MESCLEKTRSLMETMIIHSMVGYLGSLLDLKFLQKKVLGLILPSLRVP